MRLSRNKIVKLLNGKKQSRKKMKYNHRVKKKNKNSFRKKKPLNLRLRTLKNFHINRKGNVIKIPATSPQQKLYIGGTLIQDMMAAGKAYLNDNEKIRDFTISLVKAVTQTPPVEELLESIIDTSKENCNNQLSDVKLYKSQNPSTLPTSAPTSGVNPPSGDGARGRTEPNTNSDNESSSSPKSLPSQQSDTCIGDSLETDEGKEKLDKAIDIIKKMQQHEHTVDPNHGVDEKFLAGNIIKGIEQCHNNRDITYVKEGSNSGKFMIDGKDVNNVIDLRDPKTLAIAEEKAEAAAEAAPSAEAAAEAAPSAEAAAEAAPSAEAASAAAPSAAATAESIRI